jgi:hypothetical protein
VGVVRDMPCQFGEEKEKGVERKDVCGWVDGWIGGWIEV